jgi:ethanolamine kinase
MAPSDYIQARQKTDEPVATVDEQPYLPFLEMDPNDHDSIKTVVAEILKASLGDGVEQDTSNWTVQVVLGGITNKLLQVSGLTAKPANARTGTNANNNSVLVRVFGGHGLIDRDVETSTFAALARQTMAVAYLGRFANGRLEDWCEGMKALGVHQMGAEVCVQPIARALGRIHSQFEIPEALREHHDPDQPPTLWTQLDSWWNQANTKTATIDENNNNNNDNNKCNNNNNNNNNNNYTQRAAALELEKIGPEISWLRTKVIGETTEFKNTVGFCHNDLLAANILYQQNEDNDNGALSVSVSVSVQLIDFEYGGMNYWSYDIANHFNEYAGGTTPEDNGLADYSLFPDSQVQRQFVTEYLKTVNNNNNNNNNKSANSIIVTDRQVDDLLQEIRGFVLANHLVWGLWAVNQAASEGCDEFDYLQYAECRLGQYWIDKKHHQIGET